MGVLANLPAPVRFFFVTGGTLLGALSDRLPDQLQDAGLVLAFVLVLMGLIGTVQHVIAERRADAQPRTADDMRNIKAAPPLAPVAEASSSPSEPKSIAELFKSDFPTCLRQDRTDTFMKGGKQYQVGSRRCMEFMTNTMFMAFWVPHSDAAYELCIHLATEHKNILEQMRGAGVEVKMGIAADTAMTDQRDLTFSGRVYIYHDDPFSDIERGEIVAAFKQNGASAMLRGSNYAYTQWLLSQNGKADV